MSIFKKKQKFEIEFYPLSNKYFPKYNGNYLKEHYNTGIIECESWFIVADSFDTEKEALHFIDKFKEQYLKENIKIIPVN